MLAGLDSCMHLMMDAKRSVSEITGERLPTPVHPGSETLRRAIRANIVSFPSQIPTLLKCPPADTQWRIVLLFFIRGWSSSKIGARFSLPRHRIWNILNGWSVRALGLGYIQVIDPEAFAACCHLDVELPHVVPAAVEGLSAPVEKRPEDRSVDAQGTSVDLIGALDAAIAQCEAWRDEFWVRTATLLRELRAVAAALEVRRSREQTEELFPALEYGENGLRPGMTVRDGERGFHAVV